MITFLALLVATTLFTEPPEVLAAFPTLAHCQVEAAKLNNQHAADLLAKRAAFVCLEAKENRI